MKITGFFLLLSMASISCSTNQVAYKPQIKKQEGEKLVTVNSSMDLAYRSFMAGCLKASIAKFGKSNRPYHNKCKPLAKEYMKDIEEIMNTPLPDPKK